MAFGCATNTISVILLKLCSTYTNACLMQFFASFLNGSLTLILFLTSSSFRIDFINYGLPWFRERFFMIDLYLVPSTFFCDAWQLQGWERSHLQMSMMNRWLKLCRRDWKWRADPLLKTTLHNIFLKLSQGMHAFDFLLTYDMSSRSTTCVGRFSRSKNLINMLSNKIH